MNEFVLLSEGGKALAVILGFFVLLLSLQPTKTRVMVMAFCYGLISVAFSSRQLLEQIVGIRMVQAFGGEPVQFRDYARFALELIFFTVPVAGLFVSTPRGRWIGLVSFCVVMPLMLLTSVAQIQSTASAFVWHGMPALVLAALWLRIYGARMASAFSIAQSCTEPGDDSKS